MKTKKYQWSWKHEKCIKCFTTEIKHQAKGLCRFCYNHNNSCKDCNKIIKLGSKRCHPCAIKFSLTGKPLSKEHRKKLSDIKKKMAKEGKLVHFIKYGPENHMYGIKQEEIMLIKKSTAMKRLIKEGKLKTLFKKGHTPWLKGKTSKEDSRILTGENAPNWQGGKSYEPYTIDFNDVFRESIRGRDNRCCAVCNEPEEKLPVKLHVHHVDYNKLNSFKENCISLCRSCHLKTNQNRNSWTIFFQNLLKERYKYQYTQDQKIILDFNEGYFNG